MAGSGLKQRTKSMNIYLKQKEAKRWWAVTDSGVQRMTGYSCKPINPTTWWCPSVGYSLMEGHHLFKTKDEALKKAIAQTELELAELHKHLNKLKKG